MRKLTESEPLMRGRHLRGWHEDRKYFDTAQHADDAEEDHESAVHHSTYMCLVFIHVALLLITARQL